MPATSSSSVIAARQHLAQQLRELRQEAGLTGGELGRRAGWNDGKNKVSRIERGVRAISPTDLRTWCAVCEVSQERTEELAAELREVASMWQTHRQLNRGGLKWRQERLRDRYETVRVLRNYQNKVIPGLLQTEALATCYLTSVRTEQQVTVDDVAEAVAARMERQTVLRRPGKRFFFVMEQAVLGYRPCEPQVHADQLRHLLEVMRLPAVSLGVIPSGADRRGINPDEAFTMFDDRRVAVELVSGYLQISTPQEVQMYADAWTRLHALAVHGRQARELIRSVLDDLDQANTPGKG